MRELSTSARRYFLESIDGTDDVSFWIRAQKQHVLVWADFTLESNAIPPILRNGLILRAYAAADDHAGWYSKPYCQHIEKLKREELSRWTTVFDYLNAAYLIPGFHSNRGICDAVCARMRCLRLVALLSEPGQKRQGQLDQLGLSVDSVADPFDGKPLRIKRDSKGVTVYSVGRDLVDDGGKLGDSGTDLGFGPEIQ